jgi:peptidoglycan-associated lipoprotein
LLQYSILEDVTMRTSSLYYFCQCKSLLRLLTAILLITFFSLNLSADNSTIEDSLIKGDFEEIVRFDALLFEDSSLTLMTTDKLLEITQKIKSLQENHKELIVGIVGHTRATTDDENEKTIRSDAYASTIVDWFRSSLDTNTSEEKSKQSALDVKHYFKDHGVDEKIMQVAFAKGDYNAYTDETAKGEKLSDRVMVSLYIGAQVELDADNDGKNLPFDKCPNTHAGINVVADGCKLSTIVALMENDKDHNAIVVKTQQGSAFMDEPNKCALVKSKNEAPTVSEAMSAQELEAIFGSVITSSNEKAGQFTLYFNGLELTKESKEELSNIFAFVQDKTDLYIKVIGHTDTKGSFSLNDALAQKRAELVASSIKKHKVSYLYLGVESYGEYNLAVQTADDVVEQNNRRVEIFIR